MPGIHNPNFIDVTEMGSAEKRYVLGSHGSSPEPIVAQGFQVGDRVKILKVGDSHGRIGHIDDFRRDHGQKIRDYRVCFAGSFTVLWCNPDELENAP